MQVIRMNRRRFIQAGALATGSIAVTGRWASAQSDAAASPAGQSIVVYSGQHESLAIELGDAFTAASGIGVTVRAGEDADLVNQIIEEGNDTNADAILTEEPGPAATLDAKGLLAPVDPAALAQVDERFVPSTGNWLPYAARSRVIFFNPNLIEESALPVSVLDLGDDEWKGRFAYAPSGAFTSTVVYLINTIGEDDTLAWLRGIQKNGENLVKNGAIRDGVEAGQVAFGLSNHYYWYILAREKGGADKLQSRVHWVKGQDPGGLIFASAVGIPAASKHPELAARFVAWMGDPAGGQAIIASNTPQYPVAPGVESSYDLPPLSELDPPVFDQGSLTDPSKAAELIIEAGII